MTTCTHIARRRGFTLVEMLIVIAIIIVLVGLTVTAGLRFRTGSQVRETENLLETLNVAVTEWRSERDRSISFGADGEQWDGTSVPLARYDINRDAVDTFHIVELVEVMRQSSRVRELIDTINDRYLHRIDSSETPRPLFLRTVDADDPCGTNCLSETNTAYNAMDNQGRIIVLDPWGMPIRIIHPGPLWQSSFTMFDRDDDGTVRTEREDLYGVARNRQVIFVSAGPDRKFGNRTAAPDTEAYQNAQDNIYSGAIVQQAEQGTP